MTTVFCNESREHIVYQNDEHGFDNLNGFLEEQMTWMSSPVGILMLMAPVFHPIRVSSPFIDRLIYRVKIGIICWRLSMILGIDIVDMHFVFEPTLGPFVAIPRRYAHYNAAGHRFVAEQA